MKAKQQMDVTMSQPAKVLQGPGFATVGEVGDEISEPSRTERILHNTGYIEMANLPPRKFWNSANIGNILTILLAMAALAYFLWNTAIDVGVQRERNRVNEATQKQNADDIDKLYKILGEDDKSAESTPTPRSKK